MNNGSIDSVTGLPFNNSQSNTRLRTVDFIDVLPNMDYNISYVGSQTLQSNICLYGKNRNYLGKAGTIDWYAIPTNFTTTPETYYIKIIFKIDDTTEITASMIQKFYIKIVTLSREPKGNTTQLVSYWTSNRPVYRTRYTGNCNGITNTIMSTNFGDKWLVDYKGTIYNNTSKYNIVVGKSTSNSTDTGGNSRVWKQNTQLVLQTGSDLGTGWQYEILVDWVRM